MSHTTIDQPGGPSSQRLTSSGLVMASKTSLRGASKTRVITISRSPEVVIVRWPTFFIVVSFRGEFGVAAFARMRGAAGGGPAFWRMRLRTLPSGDRCEVFGELVVAL